jgi:hypothetical protein
MVKMNVQTGALEKPKTAAADAGADGPQFGGAAERKGPGYDDGSQGGDLTDLSGDAAEPRAMSHEMRSRERDARGPAPVAEQALPPALPSEAARRQPSAPPEEDGADPDEPSQFHKLQKGAHLHNHGYVAPGRPMVEVDEAGRPTGRARATE